MTTTTQPRYARLWHTMVLNERRLIKTLGCYQIQSQVGKVRKKHPECSEWRWRTQAVCGGVIVTRVR